MIERKTITGDSSDEIWQQINNDFITGNGLHDYHIAIQQDGVNMDLDMTSSPGGSDEGGYEITTLSAPILAANDFRFEIYPEDIINKVGKFFGLQDIKIGYPEFDAKVIVQSNNEQLLKKIFADEEVRELFQNMSGFSLKTVQQNDKEGKHLELYIQRIITNAGDLHNIVNAFQQVLTSINE